MERSAIYAAPALYEPFGLGILEAALAGCALVLGDIPTLRELWEGAAEFVPPRDSLALQRALARLMERGSARGALVERSRQRALGYSPAAQARDYRALYRQLMAGSGADLPQAVPA
jgi:glycosyltransferase involved in cell wall biosynthesis